MDELLGRRVPHSAPAEQAVIGSMLIDPRCIPEVIDKLKAEEFYIKLNRDIYETMFAMFSYGMTIDPVTVLDQMKVRGVYDDSCDAYMAELMRVTPTAANVMEYAAIVRDRALLRHLAETADEINNMVYEGAGEADSMLEAAERKIYALRQGRNVGGLLPIATVVQSTIDELSAAAESGKRIPGLETGFADLDRMILGLNKSDLVLIAARPGMGKTSIALNMALHVAMNNKQAVVIFSLEMSREQLVTRLLSRAALVPLQNLLTGQLNERQWASIAEAAQALSATDIRIDDNQSRTQAVSDISRMMKIMAKELNVPVVTASQLSRANENRQDKRPMLSDLRESGAIEQDADVVIGIYRDGYYNKESENPTLAEAIVLKNRKGATGTVELTWLPEYTSFGSVERRRDDEY